MPNEKITARDVIDAMNNATRDQLLALQKVLVIRVEYPNCKIDPMTREVETPVIENPVFCSACGNSQSAVEVLIHVSPTQYICSECVGICNEIIEKRRSSAGRGDSDVTKDGQAS